VLDGACTLIVEGEERILRGWDFFHCPPGTEHIIVAAEGQDALILAVGARGRGRGGITYTVCEAAARHGACVERETTSPQEAYAALRAALPRSTFVPYRRGWLPDDPA
jgi:uncharacterized cupin superfamily protein